MPIQNLVVNNLTLQYLCGLQGPYAFVLQSRIGLESVIQGNLELFIRIGKSLKF